ncbi:hypothetical protein PHSC3_001774 [Chlamydiales bacterium STE3]|nr:hypothetical protein PHSC3_001774 [Chlamydiales bacterium STE3]
MNIHDKVSKALNYLIEPKKFQSLSSGRKFVVGGVTALTALTGIGILALPFVWKGMVVLLFRKITETADPKVAELGNSILNSSSRVLDSSKTANVSSKEKLSEENREERPYQEDTKPKLSDASPEDVGSSEAATLPSQDGEWPEESRIEESSQKDTEEGWNPFSSEDVGSGEAANMSSKEKLSEEKRIEKSSQKDTEEGWNPFSSEDVDSSKAANISLKEKLFEERRGEESSQKDTEDEWNPSSSEHVESDEVASLSSQEELGERGDESFEELEEDVESKGNPFSSEDIDGSTATNLFPQEEWLAENGIKEFLQQETVQELTQLELNRLLSAKENSEIEIGPHKYLKLKVDPNSKKSEIVYIRKSIEHPGYWGYLIPDWDRTFIQSKGVFTLKQIKAMLNPKNGLVIAFAYTKVLKTGLVVFQKDSESDQYIIFDKEGKPKIFDEKALVDHIWETR